MVTNPFKHKKLDIKSSVGTLKTLIDTTKNLKCPNCSKNLILRGAEGGSKGTEVQVACSCGLGGIVNTSGFKYQFRPTLAKTERDKK